MSALLAERPETRATAMKAMPEDGELVEMTLRGNPEAFATLVERYDRAVYHLSYRMLHHTEDARDVTQEAFFKAFRSLRTFKPGAKFSTWVFAIAYHACCDRLSRRKRDSSEELPDRADPAQGPEQQAIAADDAARLRRAIDALPEKYRAVITLFHLQGQQYEEIANVLGLPMGTVKTHLFRAKEQLRRLLEGTEVTES
ncbi:MAG TPA: RNA polymerase sigma factor [Candidatus Cybelea sp.]|nr:RNA polymerase sigma factor [Candidatus Cybelea sp.]